MRVVGPGLVGVLLLGAALTSCARSDDPTERAPATTHTVVMEGIAFQPEIITIAPGDQIVWVNKDLVPHSATSTAAGFDSKVIERDGSWRYTADHPGDFAYVCTFHPGMTGTLHVR